MLSRINIFAKVLCRAPRISAQIRLNINATGVTPFPYRLIENKGSSTFRSTLRNLCIARTPIRAAYLVPVVPSRCGAAQTWRERATRAKRGEPRKRLCAAPGRCVHLSFRRIVWTLRKAPASSRIAEIEYADIFDRPRNASALGHSRAQMNLIRSSFRLYSKNSPNFFGECEYSFRHYQPVSFFSISVGLFEYSSAV